MVGKSIVLLAWFPLAFALLFVNLGLLKTLGKSADQTVALQKRHPRENTLPIRIASDTTTGKVINTKITAGDARALLLTDFLSSHESPMTQFANVLVAEADKNAIDFRIVTAIAMCESNLGKRIPSSDSYNAWGIAVYTGQQNGATFTSWPSAIAWVSKYVRERYYDRGITELEDIGAIWAPPSVENGHSWANCVREFKSSIY
jgi:hypothetical protein